jgi:hypothetical protein
MMLQCNISSRNPIHSRIPIHLTLSLSLSLSPFLVHLFVPLELEQEYNTV